MPKCLPCRKRQIQLQILEHFSLPPSAAQSKVTDSPSTIQLNGKTTITLIARDANGQLLHVGGASVAFSLGTGTAEGTFSAVTDHGNGTYTATFTGTTAGTNTIVASINGATLTSTAPTITVVGAADASQSAVSISPSAIQVNGTTTVTLTAKDANGNQEPTGGLTVVFSLGTGNAGGTFSSVTDHGNGIYTATFTGTILGTNTITASINGTALTSTAPTITVTPSLTLSAVTVSPSSIVSGTTSTVTLTTTDANGTQEFVPGLTVVFGLGAGTGSGTFSSVTDNGNGTYTATFTGTTAGTNTITATIDGSAVTSTAPTITVTPAPASPSQSTVSISPSSIALNGTTTVALTARDANGNQEPTGGSTVVFSLGAGTGSGTFSSVTDNGDGTYTAIFTGTVAGTNTITATIDGTALTSTAPTITIIGPADTAQSTVSISPSTIELNGTTTVTLTARDANGNQEPTGGSTVVFSLGAGTANGTFSSVTDNGNGTYTATFTGTTLGTNTITATIDGTALTSTAPTVTVTIGPVDPSQTTVSVSPSSIQVNGTSTVTLTARDSNGNQEPTGGSTVVFSLGAGTGSGTFSSVTDNGDGTYTATFTGTVAGTNTITATIDGTALTSTAPSITIVGPADAAQSTVTLSPSTIALNGTTTVTLTARDANGNQEPTGGSTVVFSLGAGTGSGTFSSVTDNGDGTYTAIFTGTVAGTNTITATIDGTALTSTAPTITIIGPADAAQSTVTLSPSTIDLNGTTTVTLTARDANGNQEPTGGSTVVFSLGAGTGSGTFSSVTDNGDGTYTATFTGTIAGANTITATIDGTALTSTAPTITIVGPADPSQSTVSVNPASIQSGGTTTVTLTARDANGNQEPTGGSTVVFSLGAGSANGTFSSVTDNGDGTYTATFTGTVAGTNTITASIDGTPLTSTAPTITVTPGPVDPSQTTVSVSPSSIQVNGTSTVTLTARDSNGNQEPTGGSTVVFSLGAGTGSGTFSSVTDNGDGTYTATFTGTVAGTNTITATIDGTALTSTAPSITIVGPADAAQSTVTLSPSTIDLNGTTTVTLTARDANGNQEPTGGSTVVFSLGAGTGSGTFSSVTDNGDGTYTATFTGTIAGANTITATIDGTALTSTAPTITIVGPADAAQSTVTLSPSTIDLNGTTTVTLTARDANGNQEPTGGSTVVFSLGAGTGSGTFSSVTDNGDGTYTATFTGTIAGANTITATIDGTALTSTAPTITIVGPADPSQSTVSVNPASIQSGGTTTVTLTARDANGNQEPTGGSTVVFSLGAGSANGTFSSVTDNGDGTYTATFTGTVAGTNTITASIDGTPLTSTAPTITVTPGPVDPSQTTVSVSPSSIQVNGTSTVTLTARDSNGNQEPTGGSTVVFSLGAGTGSGTFSSVTDNGDGTYTATFTGTVAGTNTITATIDGTALTSTAPSITIVGPADAAQSTVTLSPSTIDLNGTTTVTLTARDANGNQEPTGGSTVVFSLGAGTGSGTFSSVTDNGDGTYTATFTGTIAGANTITATIDGTALTSTAPTITIVGPADAAQSTVTLSPSTIDLNGTTTVTLTARDANGNQEPTGGSTVVFSLGAGTGSGTFSSVTDNGDGTYTATFTGTIAGANTITATIDGTALTSTAPSITIVGPADAAQSTVTLSPSTIDLNGTTTVTLTARDANGNQEPTGGSTVVFSLGAGTGSGTFSSVTDNGDGTYTATFTGTIAGANTITATIDGTALTSTAPTITIVGPADPSQSTVSVNPASIQSGGTTTVTLTARDANGNQEPTGGLTVVFSLGGGGTGGGTFSSVTDNGNGTYTATFTGTTLGSNTIVATIDGNAVTSTAPTINVTPSLSQSTLSASPSTINVGDTTTITLTTRDANGNPATIGGMTVQFGLDPSSTATGTFDIVTDNGDGTYYIVFTATGAGTADIFATIDGQLVTTLTTVIVNP